MKIKTIKSFKCAFKGLNHALEEQTFKILSALALLTVFFMFFLGVSFIEKTVLILAVTLVLGIELINTQVEKTLDVFHPDHSESIRKIKDISAAAVLIASAGAALVGGLIFLPYIFSLLGII